MVRPQGWGWAQASWSRWQAQTLEVSKEGPALGQKAGRRPSAPCRGERGREVAPYAVPRAAVPLRLAPLQVLGRALGRDDALGQAGRGTAWRVPGVGEASRWPPASAGITPTVASTGYGKTESRSHMADQMLATQPLSDVKGMTTFRLP